MTGNTGGCQPGGGHHPGGCPAIACNKVARTKSLHIAASWEDWEHGLLATVNSGLEKKMRPVDDCNCHAPLKENCAHVFLCRTNQKIIDECEVCSSLKREILQSSAQMSQMGCMLMRMSEYSPPLKEEEPCYVCMRLREYV